jgi:hypothetical protein
LQTCEIPIEKLYHIINWMIFVMGWYLYLYIDIP